ncbi:MAG TPA: hypothetical protein PLS10_14690 [Chitinophagales bacterium]|nr:hypothetical protein [Chitinophagales bacterium]
MNEINQTIIWVGSIKWKLQEFVVEVELEKQGGCVYVNEIRNLYWNDKATGDSKEIIDLVVDLISDKDYDALSEAIVASYLDSKQKGE